jgi:hypothetical protein
MSGKMDLDIKLELPIIINWDKFAPVTFEKQLKISITDTITVRIGFDNLKSSFIMGFQPNDLKGIFTSEYITFYITGQWSNETIELLRTNLQSSELDLFRNEIKSIFSDLYYRFIDIIRNHFHHYWLDTTLLKDDNIWNNVLWLDEDNNWKPVFPKIIHLVSEIHTFGLSETDWQELGNRLQERKRTDMIETMIVNAITYLKTDNTRMAIVEAVTALEATFKQKLPKILSNIVSPPLSDDLMDKTIENMGLRLTSKLLFEHLNNRMNFNPDDCELVIDAIEVRNTIIHKKRASVDKKKASDMVTAISKIVKCINNY